LFDGDYIMASARMPDCFFDLVAHHLPPEQPVGEQGGRPAIGHRPWPKSRLIAACAK